VLGSWPGEGAICGIVLLVGGTEREDSRMEEQRKHETGEWPDMVLDLERLTTNCHGNLDIVAELVNHLLQKSAPKWTSSLEEGLQSGDSEYLQGVCHAMKGAAATVFSWHVAKLAREFEGLARDGELESLKKRLPELQQAFVELEQWRKENL